MPCNIDNPMILSAYTIARGPSLDDDYDETRHEDEAFARRVRNRQEEHPAIDAYEERQIERFDMVGFTNKLLEQMGGAR